MVSRREHIKALAEEALSWRRELHKHPQTMYEESFASNFIMEHLKA
jgi:metal-dependent amidase/aminoacylase/carboxypeptidase family protein